MATLPIVDTQDKRIGLVSSAGMMLILFIVLWIVRYEIVDPPPADLHLVAAEPLDKTIIKDITIDAGGGGGGDSPSPDPVKNTQTTQQVMTNTSTTTVNSGQAHTSTTHNSNNPPSGNNVDNPFGNGGNGTGNGQGAGSGIGNDNGPGTGTGTPSNGGGSRSLMATVNANDIQYNYDVKFVFNVAINADGYVVDVQNIKSLTTTTDEIIIRKVMELVKSQVRYSKSPGATYQNMRYTVNFKAT